MKRCITLLLVLFSVQLFAQVSGKSKPGKLFDRKKTIQQEIFSEPRIIILSPNTDLTPLTVSEDKLIIHGKIEDEYGIKSASINLNPLNIMDSGEFFYESVLQTGNNTFSIEVMNNKSKSVTRIFKVEYTPKMVLMPIITLLEPALNSKNEFVAEKDKIILRGKVENFKDVTRFVINNVPTSLSSNGEYFYQLELNKEVTPVKIIAVNEQYKQSELNIKIVLGTINSTPTIVIIEPFLPPSNELNHNESIITIRGRIDDNFDIRNIEVNGNAAALLGQNEFFSNINLNDGINNIVISATNVKGNSSQKIFKILTPVDDEGPEISIMEPAVSRGLKIVRKKDVLNIRGKITDRSGVLNVTVNNREVSLLPNKEFNSQLYLGFGDNTIIVRATDRKNNVTTDTFFVTREKEKVIKIGKYIALVIGINSYGGYWHPLRNAVNDASGVAEVLKEKYLFDEIHTLLDKEATRKNIIKKFEWIINNSTRDDNILIFYAGHGQFKRTLNKGYWVPVDATSNSTADYISNNDIKTFIGGIPSKHTLLISDACFAGDIFRGSRAESIPFDPTNMTKYYKEVHNKPSRLALTSGSLEQVSDAGRDNHSIFTYFLIKSLENNNQKYFDASQLFNDFRMAVTNNSDQTPQLQVVRDTNDEGGQFIFIKRD
jgi:caspase domain-containing protein/glucodextranase-like protein